MTVRTLFATTLTLTLISCGGGGGGNETATTTPPLVEPPSSSGAILTSEEPTAVKDNPAVYAVEDTTKVIQGTVRTYDGTFTFADVNNDIDSEDDASPTLNAHITLDNYPDDGLTVNATIRQRGQSAREAAQKSYRVKLNKDIAHWRGEDTFQLNKHAFELVRVRNKLAFDLFREIPYISALRTQFMRLNFVNYDKNGVQYASGDYGLFTHVEKIGKEYLVNRGLPTDGNIYKAEDFQFRMDNNLKIDASGKYLDKAAFERTLSLQVDNKNHKKLIEMLTALNDPSSDFDTVFNRYFDKNNYLTWLACNILMGNHDTISRNFDLYQPKGSDKFYFIPWDYDDTFGFEDQPSQNEFDTRPQWERSVSNWWDVPLHRRFLQDPKHLEELKQAVELIRNNYLTEAKIKAKLDSYKPLVRPLISKAPDLTWLPTLNADKMAEWESEWNRIPGTVKENRDLFFSGLEAPMPYYQSAHLKDGQLALTWDRSVDLQGDPVTYRVQLSTTPTFSSLTVDQVVANTTELKVAIPANGTYYLKVIATDSKGHSQQAFDHMETDDNKSYMGVFDFTVQDGTLTEVL